MGQFCPETQTTNYLAVFDHFGIVKYKIFRASGGFAPLDPHQRPALYSLGGRGAYSAPRPQLDKGMTYGQSTDHANTFFIYILAGSYDFCRVVTFLVPKMIMHWPCYTVNIARPLKCDKLQHNPLVLSFALSKILGSMKEILSRLPATGFK